MRATITLLASTALLALGVSAQGQIGALESASNYCFFLPPSPGGDIAANEDSAIAFCNQANPNAPGAKIFPDGFVLSAHWATGDGWVQITGQIDPSKYSLSPCDQGGQYDIRAPVGASCAGYGYFVNVIEPYDGVYGMRCCTNKGDCNVSQSTYGVRVIFGSQYDFSGPRADGPVPGADQCDGSTTTTATTTTAGATTSSTTTALPSSTSASGTTTIAQTSTTTVPASSSSASAIPTTNSTTTTPNPTSAASSSKIAMAATALLACVAGVLIA